MDERFLVDDCGTLIDMVSRDTYDYVGDVCSLLNNLNSENEQLKKENKKLQSINNQLETRLETSGVGIALKMK